MNIALFYDDAAYTEALTGQPGSPAGLMGRQVAGKEFLDAWLSHGTWDRAVALVKERPRADSLVRLCQQHPSSRARRRGLQIVTEAEFHDRFFPEAPAGLLMLPTPLDARFAWARQHGGPAAFALCGVTHTLSSAAAVGHLCELVTAPYEAFDALICTSEAVRAMVRAVTGAYAEHLRERHGGSPGVRARLEVIPLGVNEAKFRPPTADERAARRRAFGVADDEAAVLFVGRLSHHAKAHPTPLFRGLSRAARNSGRKVHLLLAGWAALPAIRQAFLDGARVFAPNVRVSLLDGTDPAVRQGAWHAADVFASLSDNIQETFGLTVIEAMASGLPVVASDWDGYRDLVGEAGLLVPTYLLHGATESATSRLLFGAQNYDGFLAECSQATVVDIPAAGDAFTRLLSDPALGRAMGAIGRRRVEERFSWAHVIRRYEALWAEQQAERRSWHGERPAAAPSWYPPPEHSFAGYPTAWLTGETRLRTVDGARGELEIVTQMPLTSHAPHSRVTDLTRLRAALDAGVEGCTLSDLDEMLGAQARATVAWLLKHGLMEREPPAGAP